MKRVDLNLAYFSHQGFRTTFLSALGSEPFRVSEPTSDFLAFFGFGSGLGFGVEEKSGSPDFLDDFVNFELPCVDQEGVTVFTVYQTLVEVLRGLRSAGVVVDAQSIKHIVTEIFRQEPVSWHSLQELIQASVTAHSPPLPNAVEARGMVTFSVKNGVRYLSFGIHAHDSALDMRERLRHVYFAEYPHPIWVRDAPGFNWDYYTQLGGYEHAVSILKTMLRHKFVTDWDECSEILNKTIAALDRFYSAVD